jgi:hypothetical protein
VHVLSSVHDTLDSELIVDPDGFRVLCVVQVVPFHSSARVMPLVELSFASPTAVHAFAAVHETATRPLYAGAGTVWTDQLIPFHCAARTTPLSKVSSPVPMAMHVFADGHDAPVRLLSSTPEGFGVAEIFHALPFHSSASISGRFVLFT